MGSRSSKPTFTSGGTGNQKGAGHRRARTGKVIGSVATACALAITLTGTSTGEARAQDANYVALGDSYSSGLGTRDYHDDGSDCHRSPLAYPELAADTIGAQLTLAACSGAEVPQVLSEQLGSLDESTTHVSVSVGGNDAGFTSVITQCALPWPFTCWDDIDEANRFISEDLPAGLDELYGAIDQRAPEAWVVAVGYPRLFNGEQCNALARISPEEQAELNATADLLAQVTAERAAASGNGFVDPRAAFDGHAVCDDEEWLNGLSNPVNESYHPNQAGHASGYAPLVTDALQSQSPAQAPQQRAVAGSVAEKHQARAEATTDRPGKAEMRALHEHLVDNVAPCLRAEGYDVGASPSLPEFAATYGTAEGWDPFEPLAELSRDERSQTVDACSQLDKLEWDYPAVTG